MIYYESRVDVNYGLRNMTRRRRTRGQTEFELGGLASFGYKVESDQVERMRNRVAQVLQAKIKSSKHDRLSHSVGRKNVVVEMRVRNLFAWFRRMDAWSGSLARSDDRQSNGDLRSIKKGCPDSIRMKVIQKACAARPINPIDSIKQTSPDYGAPNW